MWWNEYIGLKFKEKGRDANGVDCWGLVCLIYKEKLGISLPDYTDYYTSTNDKKKLTELMKTEREEEPRWVEQKTPQEFDVLLLKMDGMPFHVGIYTHDGQFIHCEKGADTNHAKMKSFRWRNSVAGVFRWVK